MKSQIERRVIRKSWKHLNALKNAGNMIQVEQLINDVLLDSYGLRDKGLQKIKAIKAGNVDGYFQSIKVKESSLSANAAEIISIAKQYIPYRMKSTLMYKSTFA